MEVDRFNGARKGKCHGVVALVLDLAKAFERISLPQRLGDALQLPKEELANAVRVF